ncbi:hypothetical protein-transmembrane prediction [Rhodopirellula baltica SH 1]|uniref:Uncharacterized protein n=1 Tax=Rhodopirellula baltica (strain DSM 10527 / NCIMB 13988 / SH1) TaxID=243090 RepID=Q7UQ07_RHOBA|nr:hypothetical protein-transmembrane prediction [Rhodopirellula baltica SH 1]
MTVVDMKAVATTMAWRPVVDGTSTINRCWLHVHARRGHINRCFHHRGCLHDDLVTNGSVLHCRNHHFAYALLVQRDDVRHDGTPLNTAGCNLIQHHAFADTAAAHRDDVVERDGCGRHKWRYGRLWGNGSCVVAGLRVIPLLSLQLFVFRVAKQSTGNGSDGTADCSSRPRFVVVVADDRACDRAGDTTQSCTTLGVGLCHGVAWGEDSRCQHSGTSENQTDAKVELDFHIQCHLKRGKRRERERERLLASAATETIRRPPTLLDRQSLQQQRQFFVSASQPRAILMKPSRETAQ